jgi:hypothetical protein
MAKTLNVEKILDASVEFRWSIGKLVECSAFLNDNIRQHLMDLCKNHIKVLKECQRLESTEYLDEVIQELIELKKLL